MAVPETQEDEGLGDLLGRLVVEGKGYARAEIGYYRALVAAKMGDVTGALWKGVAALVLANAAIIALLVGAILALATLVGPGWATLIVVLLALVVAAIFGWMAYGHVKRLIGIKP